MFDLFVDKLLQIHFIQNDDGMKNDDAMKIQRDIYYQFFHSFQFFDVLL